jgi:hypothetical protein
MPGFPQTVQQRSQKVDPTTRQCPPSSSYFMSNVCTRIQTH